MRFFNGCVKDRCMEPRDVEFVCEDFILMPGSHGGGKEGISPVRIMWGVEGYRMGRYDQFKIGRAGNKEAHCPRMILSMAAHARTYATKDRMKEWGIWVVGKEHERSAWAHLARHLAFIKQQLG